MRYIVALTIWAVLTGLCIGLSSLISWHFEKYHGFDTELPDAEKSLMYLGGFLRTQSVSLPVLTAIVCFGVAYFWPQAKVIKPAVPTVATPER